MKVNTVNAQSFRAFYCNQKVERSKEQEKIMLDMIEKSSTIDPKYEKTTSILGHLKANYNMDLFADPSSDKSSINLYISENVPGPRDNPYVPNTKLTLVGNYGPKDIFETKDIEKKLDEITGKSGTTFVNSLSTVIAVLVLLLAPAIGVAMLVKDKAAQKVEYVMKYATDSLKEMPKDTLNLAKKVIK